ncbi:secreted RxLR effector peptide protein, putative [Phytophthora infestans T30-4]|uniref:RxLR effector protein n=2 Tax=Phytophthora infestans TaxID=4787 RepID=D0NM80_PHYIT|nr:secreted RxLR effector peptide protein, putative [Phytophthora infestans T30-4]EEY60801.1 secreted RxLR effector peptide protein, putative [Phytophthora infestans T30-4]KAF4031994.1 hypothetical protein GN244_ATG16147 [Phytophthora infestans]KAF4128164.1 hypothetical protein GN958_ATG22710 [Phytophthora infestans]|eukprot:XP_002899747.1 secreted RxLR effector peptide protein, putative [Phytophthora infestans T30-4]
MLAVLMLRCTLLLVALAFFTNMVTSSEATDVKMLSDKFDLLVTASADNTGSTTAKRVLRQAVKTSQKSANYPSYESESVAAEERGWFTKVFGRIEDASESTFEKLLGNSKAKLKAFEKLEKKYRDGRQGYVGFDGPNLDLRSFKWKFFKQFGDWYDSRH